MVSVDLFTLRFFRFLFWKLLCLPFFSKKVSGGDDGIRTHDPLLAGQVLSQLSYTPIMRFAFLHSSFSEAFCLTFSRKSKVLFRSLEWISPLQDRVSIELFSRTVSRKVSSPLQSLTSVFGMGTGGPSAFVTLTTFQ